MTFGKRLQFLRKEKKITQQELADLIGIPRESIVNYENDRTTPNLDAIVKIENFFHVTATYLKGESDKNEFDTLNGISMSSLAKCNSSLERLDEFLSTLSIKNQIHALDTLEAFIQLITFNNTNYNKYIDTLQRLTSYLYAISNTNEKSNYSDIDYVIEILKTIKDLQKFSS